MSSTLRKFAQAGFTLVELLIVVIILAILAAIVIPQFSSSTVDAQESALDANLASLRSAIELFKAQHNGVYPGGVTAAGGTCTGGTAGTGTATDAATRAQAFVDHLLLASNAAGQTCNLSTIGGAVMFKFGPYLRKGIPAEPINNRGGNVIGTAVTNIVVTAAGTPIVASAAGGWAVDTISGQIIMNSSALDSGGTRAYSAH